MAWVVQKFAVDNLEVSLGDKMVTFQGGGYNLVFYPRDQQSSHAYALMLRRAARRLEEIGKGLK
jgi:hypothetical protein